MKGLVLHIQEEVLSYCLHGSNAFIESGWGETQSSPFGGKGWIAGESTVILGIGPADQPKPEKTVALWYISVERDAIQRMVSGSLIIACKRPQGGLHTSERGALARIHLNGKQCDLVGLKSIPDGHTDYFHRVPVPQIPNRRPFNQCGTVYTWPVDRDQLKDGDPQVVRIELDREVCWDIDYVALVLSVESRRLRPGIKELLVLLLGAILGALASRILGG